MFSSLLGKDRELCPIKLIRLFFSRLSRDLAFIEISLSNDTKWQMLDCEMDGPENNIRVKSQSSDSEPHIIGTEQVIDHAEHDNTNFNQGQSFKQLFQTGAYYIEIYETLCLTLESDRCLYN